MPLTRRSSASSGGSVERPAEAVSILLVDVGVHHLAARMDAGVGPSGADQIHLGRPQRGLERRRELALDRPQPGLRGPAVEVGAVVGEVDPESHGTKAYCGGA